MTIKESQWPKYQAQGAKLGPCPEVVDKDITICVTQNGKPTTMTIKESQWPKYQAQGAKLGSCPDVESEVESPTGNTSTVSTTIEICIVENGVRVTKTIKAIDWKKYEAQGATKGACPDEEDVPESRGRVTPEPDSKIIPRGRR